MLERVEQRIGHAFRDRRLLAQALTHPSYAHETGAGSAAHYERLEFLGDAVLELVVSDLLMRLAPEAPEGELTRARANAVNREALAGHARTLALGAEVRLSRGERQSGGADKDSILADVFEAVVGAVYADRGLEPARQLIERVVGPGLESPGASRLDAKSRLSEWLQARGEPHPSYALLASRGPAHRPEFEVGVSFRGMLAARGSGSSKQLAEQRAAARALERLDSGESAP
ncbi:MAG: ribonuclease III [Myxococcota bacterium]